jgi:hypothetical protein
MTKTSQPRSWATLSKEKDLTINKSEIEDNMNFLLMLCDSLNELYEKLNRLSHIMGKKIIEHNLSQEDK